jgi:dephospho-CoA kinase
MIVLGLTGSIGMGKSTAAGMLRRLGVPLFDADAAVHRLLGPGGKAVAAVENLFPGVRDDAGAIDRHRLGTRVFGDPAALRRLETVLHPMVRQAETRFVRQARAHGESLVVLDIPLLYETGAPERCDYVLVVSAPARVQRERVMRRPGMTESRFAGILRAQMPDREKRRRADFVVPTGLGRGSTFRRLRRVVAGLRQRQAAGRPGSCGTRERQCAKS